MWRESLLDRHQGKQLSEAEIEKSSLGGIFGPRDPAMPEFLKLNVTCLRRLPSLLESI